MNPVIPAPVPIPLPAPVWLLEFLLVFTFVLHVVAMNFLAGGVMMLTLSSFLGRHDLQHREFARRAARAMPPVVAFTITLGVAPLLFLQLVYGQLFYTSSVLMAWSWLAVVFFVLLGYYGVYWFSLQQDELGARAPWVILATTVLFVFVAFIFSRNMTLMLRPQDFYPLHLRHEVGSVLGPVTAPGLARLLHFLVGAAAVAGLGVALLARTWRTEAPELAVWARAYGVKWFMAGTGVEFLVGLWFLFGLPQDIRAMFLGGDRLATALLVIAVVLAMLAMVAAKRSLAAACVAIVGTLSLMAVIRHLVRVAYLRPYFDPRTLPVQGQWFVFVLFALLLVGGLATVAWMLRAFFHPAPRAT
ncbi:MAG: hypothetical protein LAP13_03345 [Acidobacteriia bacterium]|nr:hypothetical protein [Terriglobia bacterium]